MTWRVAKAPERAEAARETSPWPLVMGTALTVLAVGATIGRGLALVGALGFAASVAGWSRDVARRAVPTGEEHTKEWWAIVYLIATEFMLFVAGFVAFFDLDVLHAPGAPRSFVELNRPLTLVASLILWSSGVTAHLASRRTTGHRNAWLAATMAVGLVFLGYQAHEYLRLYGEGFTLQSGPWGSLFYALTGLHGFHVIVGLVALAMLFVPRAKPATSAIVLYWHFVDAMWILIYGIVYLKVVP